MEDATADPQAQLATIRALMERARKYRHPPAAVGWIAGGLAIAGAAVTHKLGTASPPPGDLTLLGLTWAGVFALALVAQIGGSLLQARRSGAPAWSPLATEVLHTLWPPFLAAVALTAVFAQAGRTDLVPSLWMLCYGIGGVAAGAFTSTAVRALGIAFLAAGIAQLIHPLSPSIALGATFGGFHVAYGFFVALRRNPNA